jgi:hypothetical protein
LVLDYEVQLLEQLLELGNFEESHGFQSTKKMLEVAA